MKLSIFDDLVTEGMLTEDQLLECRDEERESGQALDKVLRQKGYVSENILLELLAKRLRGPIPAAVYNVQWWCFRAALNVCLCHRQQWCDTNSAGDK